MPAPLQQNAPLALEGIRNGGSPSSTKLGRDAIEGCKDLKRARPTGFEPVTDGLEIRCSIQLSYGRLWELAS